MLKTIKIKNFRSLKDFEMEFNPDLNVIIGENDAGKTTLIDALKILFSAKKIDINDFNDPNKEVTIELDESDFQYRFESRIIEETIDSKFSLKPSESKKRKIRTTLESEKFNSYSESSQKAYLKKYYTTFGLTFRSTTKVETLVSNVLSQLDGESFIDVKSISYPISFLGSREFENIESFFEDTFFKELKEEIWNHRIDDMTLSEHIEEYVDRFKEDQLSTAESEELNEQLREFLPDFQRINPIVASEPKLNLKINVELLNSSGQEILLEKMGDGTNRRTTMAIFKHKKDKNDNVYVFDEPETHLHIKAQLDILKLLKDLAKEGKQVVITTHSPFLINQVAIDEIKLISLDPEEGSKITSLESTKESQMTLYNLGIRNIDLFFTSKLLIVEGESEEVFIPMMYEKIYGYPIGHNFLNIVKADGIRDIPNFIRILKKTFSKTDIFALMDNDADEYTKEKIERLVEKDTIHKDNIFVIGNVEFEDTFSDDILIQALGEYMSEANGYRMEAHPGDIQRARNAQKFSEAIGNVFERRTGKNFRKPIFAQYLAMFAEKDDIDEKFLRLFELISD